MVRPRSSSALAPDGPRQHRLRRRGPEAPAQPRSKTRTSGNRNKARGPRRPRRPCPDRTLEKPRTLEPIAPHLASPGRAPRRIPRTRNRHLLDAQRAPPRALWPPAPCAQPAPEPFRPQDLGRRAEKESDEKARNSRQKARKRGPARSRCREAQKPSFSVPQKKSPGARKRRGCLHNLL